VASVQMMKRDMSRPLSLPCKLVNFLSFSATVSSPAPCLLRRQGTRHTDLGNLSHCLGRSVECEKSCGFIRPSIHPLQSDEVRFLLHQKKLVEEFRPLFASTRHTFLQFATRTKATLSPGQAGLLCRRLSLRLDQRF
jgi:hypothetical protein